MRDKNPFARLLDHPIFKQAQVDYDMKEIDLDAALELDLFERPPHHISLINFLDASIGIFGTTGSGKSVTTARILEELINHDVPLTIIDKEGDFDTLMDYSYKVKTYYFEEKIETGEIIYYKKEMWHNETKESEKKIYGDQEIKEIAKKNYLYGNISVLDVSGIITRAKAMELAYNYIIQLKEVSDELKRQNIPVHHLLFVDEAHYFAPSQHSTSYDKRIAICKPMSILLASIAGMGRKRGMNLVVASQRMKHLDWDILNNIKQFFFQRTNAPPDVELYKDYISNAPFPINTLDAVLAVMQPGDVIYLIKDKIYLTKVKNRRSAHSGKTPRFSQTKRNLLIIKKRKEELFE